MATKGNQVAVAEPAIEFGSSLLAVISSAARDPAVDIDKMERLLQMQERVEARNAEVAFSEAFAIMQPNLPTVSMRGEIVHNGRTISQYAEWSDISKAISPVLSEHGFSLSFKPGDDKGKPTVTATLRHRLGHKEEATLAVPLDTSGAKNAVQSVGSSLTYAKRYCGVLVLNLTVEGEDDDGAAAAPKIQHQAPRDLPFPQGPAKNKTELKTRGRELWRDIEGVSDLGSLSSLLDEGKPLIEQLKQALPDWWTGGQKGGETFDGLDHVIKRVKRDLETAEQMAGYART